MRIYIREVVCDKYYNSVFNNFSKLLSAQYRTIIFSKRASISVSNLEYFQAVLLDEPDFRSTVPVTSIDVLRVDLRLARRR